MADSNWVERPVDATAQEALEAAGHPPLVARLLALRGISPAEAGKFFAEPNPKDDLADPLELPGVSAATDRILSTVAAKGSIVVFGDYDCDGVCATAILVRTLEALQARVSPFLPERLTEGYGMTEAAVTRMLRENPDVSLVVTVDNGINSVEPVAQLKAQGIAVVITDHHLPGDVLPDCPTVNPKVSAPPSLEGLCGAGVAFMLARAIVDEARRRGLYNGPKICGPLIVLAGLATVTDIMPLTGQNRLLVRSALALFRCWAPVGLRELHERASRTAAAVLGSKDFGFLLGPRINAAGRMASAREALELVLETDRECARELARRVDVRNVERKAVETKMTEEAVKCIRKGDPAQVIDLADGHPGVAGIVAARILDRIASDRECRVGPVFVSTTGHGSARAPEGVNVRDIMEYAKDALVSSGGHAAAGGFIVKPGQIELLRELVCRYCSEHPDMLEKVEVASHTLAVDAFVRPGDLSMELAERIVAFEPFGDGNPEPVFALRGVRVADVRPLGSDGRHLAVTIAPWEGRSTATNTLRAVWWGHGDSVEKLRADSSRPRDFAFTLAISEYGERHLELRLVAIDE